MEECTLSVDDMAAVLLELFARVQHAQNNVDVVISWMLRIFDRFVYIGIN